MEATLSPPISIGSIVHHDQCKMDHDRSSSVGRNKGLSTQNRHDDLATHVGRALACEESPELLRDLREGVEQYDDLIRRVGSQSLRCERRVVCSSGGSAGWAAIRPSSRVGDTSHSPNVPENPEHRRLAMENRDFARGLVLKNHSLRIKTVLSLAHQSGSRSADCNQGNSQDRGTPNPPSDALLMPFGGEY
jgi:hypothetical protein